MAVPIASVNPVGYQASKQRQSTILGPPDAERYCRRRESRGEAEPSLLVRGPRPHDPRSDRDDAQYRLVRAVAAAGLRPRHRTAPPARGRADRLLRPASAATTLGGPRTNRRVPRLPARTAHLHHQRLGGDQPRRIRPHAGRAGRNPDDRSRIRRDDLVLERVGQRQGLSLRTFPLPTMATDPGAIVSALVEAITPRTRLLFFSHVLSPTGLVLPAKELCAEARNAASSRWWMARMPRP